MIMIDCVQRNLVFIVIGLSFCVCVCRWGGGGGGRATGNY